MKHYLKTILITVACLVALVACGGGSDSSPSSPPPTTSTTYSVTYNGNGNDDGSVPVDNTVYQNGQTVTVAGNPGNLVKTGYSFIGWNTAADDSGTTYSQGQSFTMGAADVTLYARWSANPTYTVTYNGNTNDGGSVPVDSTNYEEGQTVTVAGNSGILTKSGYSFTGWNTVDDGSGTGYAPNGTFVMGAADVVLYAQWSANPTYTVTYDGNTNEGGSVPSDTNNYEEGQIVTVLGNPDNLAKSGHTFSGWNTEADGSGAGYSQGQTFTMGADDILLYAQWSVNPTYSVIYNGNGSDQGSVPVDSTKYEENQTVTVAGNTGNLSKPGYSFTGWNTVDDGTGSDYGANTTFAMGTADITLYAQWSANPTYTVTYNGNTNDGGSVPVDTTAYEVGRTVTVFGNTGNLTKAGHAFIGWNTQANGNGTDYLQDNQFAMGAANVTLYAKWKQPYPTILYNAGLHNGNLGGLSGANATCSQYKIGACGPTRTRVHAFLSAKHTALFTHTVISEIPQATGIDSNLPIIGPTGTQISPDWAGLLDGGIDTSLAAAGVMPANQLWWSGSMISMGDFITALECGISGNVDSWVTSISSSFHRGMAGSSSTTADPQWFDAHTTTPAGTAVVPYCGEQHYLLCVCGE